MTTFIQAHFEYLCMQGVKCWFIWALQALISAACIMNESEIAMFGHHDNVNYNNINFL